MEIGYERILRTTAALILGEIKEINVISAADVSPCCTATYLPEVVMRPELVLKYPTTKAHPQNLGNLIRGYEFKDLESVFTRYIDS